MNFHNNKILYLNITLNYS